MNRKFEEGYYWVLTNERTVNDGWDMARYHCGGFHVLSTDRWHDDVLAAIRIYNPAAA